MLIDLGISPYPAAARQSFTANPELRAVVRWVLNIVYEPNPDGPLLMFERLFESLRGSEGRVHGIS
jgi:hypothetical protein